MTEDRRKRGLGRGLSALFGEDSDATAPVAGAAAEAVDTRFPIDLPVEHMQSGRFQPRTEFEQEALQDLAESIREKGILQPILVRRLPEDANRYEIIAGERRWRAAQMVQLHVVPVLVRDFTDIEAAEVALIENLQRRDLNPLEEAEGYKRLMEEFDRTQDELSKALGKSRSHVANTMRLLGLPEPVKSHLRDGALTAGHARALLNAADPVQLADQVIKKGLNVRQTEKLAVDKGGVKTRKAGTGAKGSLVKDQDTEALERDLSNLLGLKVEIAFEGRGGSVLIQYDTLEQLDDILYRLNHPPERDIAAEEPLAADDDWQAELAAETASSATPDDVAEEMAEETGDIAWAGRG